MFGLRIGNRPRVVAATTPRPTKLIRDLLAREGRDVIVTRGTTFENADNLAPGFLDTIITKYQGTRLGQQELLAEVLTDIPGALWDLDRIDAARRDRAPDDLQRVVIGLDPAVSSHPDSDETGIVIWAKDGRGHAYVLEDCSGRYAPDAWARTAIGSYHRHGADRIIGETNQGGSMIEATLRMVDPDIPFTAVHASRGKYIRAEPVAALYYQGRVHHCRHFPQLEDQLISFTADIDRGKMGSPDRVDALVWGLTELCIEREPYAGLFSWYEQEAAKTAIAANGDGALLGASVPQAGVSAQASALLYAPQPYASFWVRSGRIYAADEHGRIALKVDDADDRLDLVRAGCHMR